MAEEKKTEAKIVLERSYNIPLRKGWLKVARYKRSKKAVKVLQEFLMKNMKTEDVRLGMHLNEFIWKHGIKNPPHHVKVHATKDEEGVVKAEMEGFEFKGAVQSKKKEEKARGLKGKLQDAMGTLKKDDPEKEKKEDSEESKKEVKNDEVKTEEKKSDDKTVKKEKKLEPSKKPRKTAKKASTTKKSSSKK